MIIYFAGRTIMSFLIHLNRQFWCNVINDWKSALNRFTIQFEEQIPQL